VDDGPGAGHRANPHYVLTVVSRLLVFQQSSRFPSWWPHEKTPVILLPEKRGLLRDSRRCSQGERFQSLLRHWPFVVLLQSVCGCRVRPTHERLLRMANFQVARQQARARRAARDLAQRLLHCSLDELDAIEEQEAEVRYRFRCIRKVMRSRSRCCSRHDVSKNMLPRASNQSWYQQAS